LKLADQLRVGDREKVSDYRQVPLRRLRKHGRAHPREPASGGGFAAAHGSDASGRWAGFTPDTGRRTLSWSAR